MAIIEIKVPDIGDFKEVSVIELMVKQYQPVNKTMINKRTAY